VKPEDLPGLPSDGFVKINIYTTLAVRGGQALARRVLACLTNVFNERQLNELVREKVLGERILSADYGETQLPIGPKLLYVANPVRRDAWFDAVRDCCLEYLKIFNYAAFA
jgi:hypothetical protein